MIDDSECRNGAWATMAVLTGLKCVGQNCTAHIETEGRGFENRCTNGNHRGDTCHYKFNTLLLLTPSHERIKHAQYRGLWATSKAPHRDAQFAKLFANTQLLTHNLHSGAPGNRPDTHNLVVPKGHDAVIQIHCRVAVTRL